MSQPPIIPVILCGGSGLRLWPQSRRDVPKQFIPAFGGPSLFQRSLQRVAHPHFAAPVVIAGEAHRFMAGAQAQEVGVTPELLLEPAARDTLAAVLAGALAVAARNPAAVALVMPSDHVIPDAAGFAALAAQTAQVAAKGRIVTLGITPTRPATGYGYIQPGTAKASSGKPSPALPVAQFIEKPDATRAAALIAAGCLWNAGIFCFAPDTMLAEAAKLAPEALAAVQASFANRQADLDFVRLGPEFARAPKISIDHAIMERTTKASVVPMPLAWSDVGEWREYHAMSTRDAMGNSIEGDALVVDSQNCHVQAGDRLVCVLGVEGLAVIDTPDALLVARLDHAQAVKQLAQSLVDAGRPEAVSHARVYRPWGWYQTMDLGERFRVKRIQVTPGKQLSLQKHYHRAEHWVVVRGTAEVHVDGTTRVVRENESVFIPMGAVHRLKNPGRIPVEIVEVQSGAYLEEDDIIRLQDDFGRG